MATISQSAPPVSLPLSENTLTFLQLGKLSTILENARIRGIVTWPGGRHYIGRASSKSVVELRFASATVAIKTIDSLSLNAIATAFLAGDLDFPLGLLEAMPSVEAINVATDSPRTICERLMVGWHDFAKQAFPWMRRRFESLDHYAQSPHAFRIMLDSHMQYTCGLYRDPRDDIETAQRNKFELIRNQYHAVAGELRGRNHLDIGCGWGGLLRYFGNRYGTRSVGITNSPQQKAYCDAISNARVMLGDFEDLRTVSEKYDLITIVGMIEHLTPSRRARLFDVVHRSLKPQGVIYLQCVQRPKVWIGGDAYRLAQRYVFPGHYLESGDETLQRIERSGFDVLWNVEHGHHYARTTSAWLQNVEANREHFVTLLGEREYRMFAGYLALASRLFESGRGSLGRYMLRKRGETRSHSSSH